MQTETTNVVRQQVSAQETIPATTSFAAALHHAVESSDPSVLEKRIGQLVARQTDATFVLIFEPQFDGDSPLSILHGNEQPVPKNLVTWSVNLAMRSAAEGETIAEASTSKDGRTYRLVAVPLRDAGDRQLLAFGEQQENNDAVHVMELAAAGIRRGRDITSMKQNEQSTKQLAALAELVSRVESAEHREAAASTLAQSLAAYLRARHVIFALSDAIDPSDNPALRVVAASHRDQIDSTSEETRLAASLLQEAYCRGTVSRWPAEQNGQHALLCHRQYAEAIGAAAVMGCPLRDSDGTLRGAILVAFDNEKANQLDVSQRFLTSAERPLGTAFNLLQRAEQTRLYRSFLKIFAKANRQKLMTTLACAAIAAVVMCIPLRYTVKADCRLEPTNKRFVAAPFAGKLLKCHVEPGDLVVQHQLLANLDGQEIEWELGSVTAELQRAIKERAGYVAGHESGKARLVQHEIEYLRSKSKLLAHRVSQLEVRSPVEGVVVSGDLIKAEGVPLEPGQTLFEISPLDGMVAEVSVPEDDVRFVRSSLPVKVHLDAFPYKPYETEIAKLHPRTQIRDNENVFVADAKIENVSGDLRPGMEGTARIKTIWRPIGWILFHKPAAAAVTWLGL